MPRSPQVATSKQASSPDEGGASSGSHADAPSQSSLSRPDGFDPAQRTAGPWEVYRQGTTYYNGPTEAGAAVAELVEMLEDLLTGNFSDLGKEAERSLSRLKSIKREVGL